MKHVGMSRSATPATRNEAMRSWKTRKRTPFAELTIGTAIWSADGCGRLRTVVANGGERKHNVRRAQLYPHTPRVKREPLLRIREKHESFPWKQRDLSDCWGVRCRVPEDGWCIRGKQGWEGGFGEVGGFWSPTNVFLVTKLKVEWISQFKHIYAYRH